MDGRDVPRAQLKQLYNHVERETGYFNRLVARMERLGWRRADAAYGNAVSARDALRALRMNLHYGLSNGCGERPRVD